MPNELQLLKRRNYRLVELQKRQRTTVVRGYPYWLTIDPCSFCNLRCVFCPTGQRRGTRTQAILPFEKYKKIIDVLGPYLYHIDFCNWGEPLLNREITKMIAYTKQYGPSMKVDSNLNVELSEEDARALISSGLNGLNMSVDGASQKTYEVYRRDGDFERVMANMKLLTRVKKELGGGPRLHWQFLVFRHNEHEIETARAMAKTIGVDSIGFTGPFCAPEWIPTIDEYNNYLVKDEGVVFKQKQVFCDWLWDGITINADGSVSPCCSVEEEKDDFGNFFDQPFELLWNNSRFRTARSYVRDRVKGKKNNICTRCDHIGASNHADAKR